MKSLFNAAMSFFVPGGPLLAALGYIFKPSRVIVWLPLLFLVVSVCFAGVQARRYVSAAQANGVLVVQQGDKIKDLQKEVQLQRQSVDTATRNIQVYTTAIQTYAKQQYAYQQEISTIRSKLEPTKITEKAQTDAKGASDDLNSEYADMLRLFDNATGAAASASGGSQGDTRKTVVTTTVTGKNADGPVAGTQKGTPAPDTIFTLTASEFKKLTDNETEFLRWIKEASAQIAYYTTETPKDGPVTAPTAGR